MKHVIDTSIVLRYVVRTDRQRERVARFIRALLADQHELCIAMQSLFEFWVVATRPIEVNGLGYAVSEARRLVDEVRTRFTVLPDPVDLVDRWLELCTRYDVKGKPAHDARIVATVVGLGLSKLVTLNAADFARYQEIECLVPPELSEPGTPDR